MAPAVFDPGKQIFITTSLNMLVSPDFEVDFYPMTFVLSQF